jgi:hypothetical protein
MQKKEGYFLQVPTLPFHFWLPLLSSHLCPFVKTLSPGIFFFPSKRKEKKQRKKKCRKGKKLSFKLLHCLSLLAPTSALSLLPFYFKHFLLISSSQAKERKKNKGKKTIEKKKNAKKGRILPSTFHSTLSLLAPTFGLMFLPFCFKCFFFNIFFFSSKRKTQRKKTIEKKTNAEKGGSLPFFSHFCIWDEALLLLPPLYISSTLSSPPSSNLVSHVSLKPCATQV